MPLGSSGTCWCQCRCLAGAVLALLTQLKGQLQLPAEEQCSLLSGACTLVMLLGHECQLGKERGDQFTPSHKQLTIRPPSLTALDPCEL